jgi:hypothetical protein
MILPTTQKYEINRLGYFYVMKYPSSNPPKHREKAKVRRPGRLCGQPGPGCAGPAWPGRLRGLPGQAQHPAVPAPPLPSRQQLLSPTSSSRPSALQANPLMMLDYRCHVDNGKIGKSFWPKLEQCLKKIGAMSPAQVYETYGYPELKIAEAVQQRARGGSACLHAPACARLHLGELEAGAAARLQLLQAAQWPPRAARGCAGAAPGWAPLAPPPPDSPTAATCRPLRQGLRVDAAARRAAQPRRQHLQGAPPPCQRLAGCPQPRSRRRGPSTLRVAPTAAVPCALCRRCPSPAAR